MKVAFLLDEMISPRVAEQLQKSGIEIRAVCGSELAGRDDRSIFRAAIAEGRMMVTYNISDFSVVYADLLKEGVTVPGLVFVDEGTIPNSDVQGLVRALTRLAERLGKGEIDPSGGMFLT
jgi:predicted nuclease of predicted toxin-antitoxin system